MAQSFRAKFLFLLCGLVFGVIIGILLADSGLVLKNSAKTSKAKEAQKPTEETFAPGRWSKSGKQAAASSLSEEQKKAIKELESLGYLSGSRSAPSDSGVMVNDEARANSGLNLVVSGHAPEAYLMDMSGEVMHTWSCEANRVWDDLNPNDGVIKVQNHTFWRRAWLMPNGDLFAIFERIGLIKLDKDSKIIWAQRNSAHHDLDFDENGNIYVLTGKAHINREYNPGNVIWEDYISILDPQGKELRRVSVLEALMKSDYASVLSRAENEEGDFLHTNTIELIKDLPAGRKSPLRNGTVLISIRNLDLVCALDMEKEVIYWAESDFWYEQHQPTLLDNGNLLVLDNKRTKNTSAVIEIEPASRRIAWSYIGNVDGKFYTDTCGSNQRLPNGNTLITESDAGRAFEVTPDKEIVWEYFNPNRAGEKHELIATLFEVVRLRKDFPVDWL